VSTTRGVLRFRTAAVQVFITHGGDGDPVVATAVIDLTRHDGEDARIPIADPYLLVTAPTTREAWASLCTLIGTALGVNS
jgi:hypothetical protein